MAHVFSYVKATISVITEVQMIFVLEFYLHFHFSSHKNVFLSLFFRFGKQINT